MGGVLDAVCEHGVKKGIRDEQDRFLIDDVIVGDPRFYLCLPQGRRSLAPNVHASGPFEWTNDPPLKGDGICTFP